MTEDPLPGYCYTVTLDPAVAYLPPAQAVLVPLVAGGEFSAVKGLGAELEVLTQPEGGRNDFVHQLPVRHSWPHITLTRGVVRDWTLWEWYLAGLTQSLGARRDGAIVLMTPGGTAAVAWAFRAGIAARWTGPDMAAADNAIALESLEIAHHGLTQVAVTAPGTP
jgi:phage tail-like protein